MTRLPTLTSLRFYAALLVVVAHVGGFSDSRFARDALHNGAVGVSFFFVLSGFILTWSQRTPPSTASFYRRRLARIWPLHAVTWIAALAVAQMIGAGLGSRRSDLQALVLMQSWTPNLGTVFAANTPSWSLSTELFFYACFPVVLPALGRMSARAQWIAVGVLAFAAVLIVPGVSSLMSGTTGDWFGYIFPPTRVLEFLIGILLALRMLDGWRPGWSLWQPAGLLLLATPLLVWVEEPVAVTLIPFAGLIVAGAAADLDGTAPAILGRPIAVRLGEWSFALYLVHNIVVTVLLDLTGRGGPALVVLAGVVVLVISVPLSAALHKVVERPAERALSGRSVPDMVRPG